MEGKGAIGALAGIIVSVLAFVFVIAMGLGGCTAAEVASWNVSQEADNFNVVRELTVFDNVTGQILFIAQGRMSITVDADESQLEIMVANPDDQFEKHFIGLNETTTYVVKDLQGVDVDSFRYRLTINPDLLIPFDFMLADGGR